MKRTFDNIGELIGHTPLLELKRIKKEFNLYGNIFAKLEFFNPGGSVKDRIGRAMIQDAIDRGDIDQNTTIIEATSGNTGIGLAMVAASLGLKIIIVMPESMSKERRNILKAYGAKLELTPSIDGMNGAIAKACDIAKNLDNVFIASQFTNPSNPKIHESTTAIEIFDDLEGMVDFFVAGVGSGGTITGVSNTLKKKVENLSIVAVEPYKSSVLSGKEKGKHGIQGIGAGFIPDILKTENIDEIVRVLDEDAFNTARMMAKTEGVLAGISGGAALKAAIEISKRESSEGKNIVVIIPDTGERYLSTSLYDFK